MTLPPSCPPDPSTGPPSKWERDELRLGDGDPDDPLDWWG